MDPAMDENTQNRALKDANNEARKCTAHARARCARAETCHRLAFGELTPLPVFYVFGHMHPYLKIHIIPANI